MLIKHGDGKVLSVVKVSDDSEEVELDENGNPVVKQVDPKSKAGVKKAVKKETSN